MMKIVIYFLIINLFSFFVYGIDKFFALCKRRRIKESLLLTLSFIGGFFGSILGMIIFRHKIRKKYFWYFNILCLSIYLICSVSLFWYYNNTYYEASKFGIKEIKSSIDYDNDGVDDYTDILLGARKDASNKPRYDSRYFDTGYPPDDIGVCADVIWRAFKEAGYNLRELIDEDIKNNIEKYPNVKRRDSNIDFRRVKNLKVFFDRYATVLTNDIKQIDEWMPGDIVVFGSGYTHIGIISDRRNAFGIPWLIHNAGQSRREENALEYWSLTRGVTGHYRWDGVKE